MDTAEMRLLTVPQFARRVNSSVDEVLALIASRDIKALRPDPEGGYRVLETEVDRILQEKMRIRPLEKAEGSPRPSILEPPTIHKVPAPAKAPRPAVEPTPARSVAMETHLTVVTSLETARGDNARLERRNSALQAELFQYRQMLEGQSEETAELRARFETTSRNLDVALESLEVERRNVEGEQATVRSLRGELEAAQAAAAVKKSFWQRLFG